MIKCCSLGLLWLVFLASTLGAADKPAPLKLTDGRVFEEWRITGESGAFVTVKFKGGLAQVSKKLLPEPQRSEYPIDPDQVKAEQAASAESRRAAAMRAAELRRERKIREEQTAITPAQQAQKQAEVQAKQQQEFATSQMVFDAAKKGAERFFRYEFEPSGTSRIYAISVSVAADEPEPWPGIPGRYTVKGKGYLDYYDSFYASGFRRATKEFTAFVDVNKYSAKVVEVRVW
jgi:hypothetical protein